VTYDNDEKSSELNQTRQHVDRAIQLLHENITQLRAQVSYVNHHSFSTGVTASHCASMVDVELVNGTA